MQTLETAYGTFRLQRLPLSPTGKKENLRAWDAADELLLAYLDEHKLLSSITNPVLLINDAFGSLVVSLHEYQVHSWSDSYLSHLSIEHNLALNQLKADCKAISSTDALTQDYDLVIIKIPKTLALLEHQLCQLKPWITKSTTIIAAGMSRHIHSSTLKYFEKIIGTTTTSRATKKARLIFAANDQQTLKASPYPKNFTDEQLEISLSNHANVFSKDRLDIGARFMIKQLHLCPQTEHIIDLGCGNGVLGIMVKRLQPQAKISFVDESYMAIDSARTNYAFNISTEESPSSTNTDEADFYVRDCLKNFPENEQQNKAGLILCNPPFHQAHSIGDETAWQMFKQSRNLLNKGGELWVIANRHLAYHSKLKRLFGNNRAIASNKKFVVLASTKNS